jgi:hypothetical protein
MADQGWGDAKGPTEDLADAGTNAEDRSDVRGEAANVVQFPRDWIGPLDELVPIDLAPDSAAAPRDAAGFWDGEIVDEQAVPAPAWDDRPRTAADALPPREAPLAVRAPWRRGRALALSGGAAALVALVITAFVAIGQSGGSPRESGHRQHVQTLTETVTTSATATKQSPRAHAVGHSKPTVQTGAVANKNRQSVALPQTGAGSEGASGRESSSGGSPDAAGGAGGGSGSGATAGGLTGPSASGTSDSGASDSGCVQSPDSGCLP